MSPKMRISIKMLVVGILEGLVFSVTPMEFQLVVVPGILALMGYSFWESPLAILSVVAAIGTVVACALIPVKPVDREIDPVVYRNMTLSEICRKVQRDYNISCSAEDSGGPLTFRTNRKMPMRKVFERLAEQSGTTLSIEYCGNGASVLFGGYVMGISFKASREAN